MTAKMPQRDSAGKQPVLLEGVLAARPAAAIVRPASGIQPCMVRNPWIIVG
jgi:hypothetical protein